MTRHKTIHRALSFPNQTKKRRKTPHTLVEAIRGNPIRGPSTINPSLGMKGKGVCVGVWVCVCPGNMINILVFLLVKGMSSRIRSDWQWYHWRGLFIPGNQGWKGVDGQQQQRHYSRLPASPARSMPLHLPPYCMICSVLAWRRASQLSWSIRQWAAGWRLVCFAAQQQLHQQQLHQ